MDFSVSSHLDVMDQGGFWSTAEVLVEEKDRVLVTYSGWPSKWNEWLEKKNPRIQPWLSKTGHLNGETTQTTSMTRHQQFQNLIAGQTVDCFVAEPGINKWFTGQIQLIKQDEKFCYIYIPELHRTMPFTVNQDAVLLRGQAISMGYTAKYGFWDDDEKKTQTKQPPAEVKKEKEKEKAAVVEVKREEEVKEKPKKEVVMVCGIECVVCLEAFDVGERKPFVLPCGHSYCRPCVDLLLNRRQLTAQKNLHCPSCTVEIPLPSMKQQQQHQHQHQQSRHGSSSKDKEWPPDLVRVNYSMVELLEWILSQGIVLPRRTHSLGCRTCLAIIPSTLIPASVPVTDSSVLPADESLGLSLLFGE